MKLLTICSFLAWVVGSWMFIIKIIKFKRNKMQEGYAWMTIDAIYELQITNA